MRLCKWPALLGDLTLLFVTVFNRDTGDARSLTLGFDHHLPDRILALAPWVEATISVWAVVSQRAELMFGLARCFPLNKQKITPIGLQQSGKGKEH